jgi:hypothetical protein
MPPIIDGITYQRLCSDLASMERLDDEERQEEVRR